MGHHTVQMSIPILLDTDPGNDIDDALAIAYLLKQKQCELLGITTVTGDTAKRAAIAEVLCRAAGRNDIPIVAGRDKVLAYGQGQPWNSQYEPISHLPHTLDRKQDEAVDFLRQTIRSRPGEITLVTIGPFQNIALLFAIDPEIPFLVKDLVTMAGVFKMNDNREWNCLVDPVATAMVVCSPRPKHTWFSLDVTTKCTMDRDECEAKFKGPLLELVLLMATKWFDHTKLITFHDPLAVASMFNRSICNYEMGTITIDPTDGKSFFTPGEGIDEVASNVNPNAFFEEFFGTIAQ
jgi:purine nucleosidase